MSEHDVHHHHKSDASYSADKDKWHRLGRTRRRVLSHLWVRLLLALAAATGTFVSLVPRSLVASLLARPASYAVVVDAGSSGTRVHVFRFYPAQPGKNSLPILAGTPTVVRRTPGLSAFTDDPSSAGRQVEDLLRVAATAVPPWQRADTPVVLLATAGLRLLATQWGDAVAQSVLDACKPALGDSGFLFREEWAHILPGPDEGAFAWVAANYAAGRLFEQARDGGHTPTVGVLELGGASAQVTYSLGPARGLGGPEGLPPGVNAADVKDVALRIGETAWAATINRLYTHSFLGIGFDAVIDLSRTWQHGDREHGQAREGAACATFAACRAVASHVLGLGAATCGRNDAAVGACIRPVTAVKDAGDGVLSRGASTQEGLFVPRVSGELLALENFKHVADALRLSADATLAQLSAAAEAACRTGASFPHAKQGRLATWLIGRGDDHHGGSQPSPPLCFAAAYVFTLLHDALGVPLHGAPSREVMSSEAPAAVGAAAVRFVDAVGDTPVDWPLGALVAQYGALAHAPQPRAVLAHQLSGLLAFAACFTPALMWALFGRGRRCGDAGDEAQSHGVAKRHAGVVGGIGDEQAVVLPPFEVKAMKRSVSNLGL
jgi:apyrase